MSTKYSLPQYTLNLKGILALIGGGFIPTFFLAIFTKAVSFFTKQNVEYDNFTTIILNMVMWMGAILVYDFLICRPQTGKRLNFNMAVTNLKTYAMIFPMMIGMMLISETITSQIPTTGPIFGSLYKNFQALMEQMTNDTVTLVVLAVIMAPLFEEIVFRGIIQKGLINGGMKPTKAIWISASIFGLVHGNVWQLIGAILLGYVLGLVYYRTKSHGWNCGIKPQNSKIRTQ